MGHGQVGVQGNCLEIGLNALIHFPSPEKKPTHVDVCLSEVWITIQGLLELGNRFVNLSSLTVGKAEIIVKGGRERFKEQSLLQKLDVQAQLLINVGVGVPDQFVLSSSKKRADVSAVTEPACYASAFTASIPFARRSLLTVRQSLLTVPGNGVKARHCQFLRLCDRFLKDFWETFLLTKVR